MKPADDGGALPGVDSKTCMQTTCTGGMLEVCGASGTVEHTEQCALGCFPDESRCNEFVPSNGLGTSLDQSALQGAITLPAGAVVNTDTGAVVSQLGTPIQVRLAARPSPRTGGRRGVAGAGSAASASTPLTACIR
jgi:hypothetical protein